MNACACVHEDAFCCFSKRYYGNFYEARWRIESDGGPCQCACHYEDDEEEP